MDGHDKDANNTQSNSANSNAQGIFSTPELTVDTENIAPTNTEETKSRVASIFANTDAGRSAEQLNNAMSVNSQPVTEDVVINNGPRKRSKVPIIVAIIVLVLAAVGAGTYFLAQTLGDNKVASVNISEAKEKFDEFATYLLFGKPEKALSGKYEAGTAYRIGEEFAANNTEYLEHAAAMLLIASNVYQQTEDRNERLTDYLASLSDNLAFLIFYLGYNALPETQIANIYSSQGRDASLAYINDHFRNYQDNESQVLATFLEQKYLYYNNYLDYISALIDAQCVQNGQPIFPCNALYATEGYNALLEKSLQNEQIARDLEELARDIVYLIPQSCWEIDALFQQAIESKDSISSEK